MSVVSDRYNQLLNRAIQLNKTSNVNRVRETGIGYSGDQGPIISLVAELIREAIERRASDLHFEPAADGIRCRLRIDGRLSDFHSCIPAELQPFVVSRLKIMSNMDISEHRQPQDGRFSFEYDADSIDVRVSVLPVIKGEKIVLRFLNDSRRMLSVANLGLSDRIYKCFMDLCHSASGAVILAGPVNSGKTTTLYAALDMLNKEQCNIITVEDPVEYQIEGINQLQVNPKAGLTFSTGLKACLRQDTDIVMLGEMRDEDTAKNALRAALTGHLLFTTLHTSGAIETLYRLLDMGIQPYQIAAGVRGIIAQRLVSKLCPHCKKPYKFCASNFENGVAQNDFVWNGTGREKKVLLEEGEIFYKSSGCEKCNYTGITGRMPINEILIMDDHIRQAISDGKNIQYMRKLLGDSMITLFEDGVSKAKQGLVSLDEIRRIVNNESM